MSHQSPFTLSGNQPLIGIPFEENGQEVIRYFSEETQADKAISADATQIALNLAGAWSDLSWKETERKLVTSIWKNLTIDWTVKESIRAKLRTTVKHLLRKYKYPPHKQEKAVQTILEQSELLCKDWAA
jgi:type I restriction enzyme, R subunit